MFNRKQKEIKKLNKRCFELSQELKQVEEENKELKEIRLEAVRNNTLILERSNKREELLKDIYNLLISNKYNDEKAVLKKVKELVETAIKKLVQ